ncbi:MAG TPA: hypothetical protein VHV82_09775 [Sporichthyaceae bacterium]|nr:hypothetical protein [Sporichthyaceae bacterium]
MPRVSGALLLGLGLLVGCTYTDVPSPGGVLDSEGPLPKGVFVARYAHGAGNTSGGQGTFLSVFDESSGKHLRDLVHLAAGLPARLGGFSRSGDGSVVYALESGPEHADSDGTGTPRPGTCGGTVYRLDASTGQVRSLFVVVKDRILGAPMVSPDGTSVAYLSAPCPGASAQEVVVHNLGTNRERTIRVDRAAPTGIGWSADDTQLVLAVSPTDPGQPAGFLVVPAGVAGTQPESAVHAAPDGGCAVEAAAFGETGVELAEGCPAWMGAPGRLLQLVGAGPTVAWRVDTHLCPTGMTLAHDLSGGLLVSSTAACGAGGDPVDVVQLWTGQTAREIGSYSNPDQFVNDAS